MNLKVGDIIVLSEENMVKHGWVHVVSVSQWKHREAVGLIPNDAVSLKWQAEVQYVDAHTEEFYLLGYPYPIPFSAWGLEEKPGEETKASVAACSCDMFTLLNYGCKCGCIQKERNKA